MTVGQLRERHVLLSQLEGFLRGAYGYDELYGTFYFHYVNDLKDDALSPEDWERFGRIHERMDTVTDDPDPESRSFGWISAREFREWLSQFLRDEDLTAPGVP